MNAGVIMPGLLHGRILLGCAVAGWGVLCVVYADFVSSLQPMPAWLPAYGPIAVLNGAFLLLSGLALMTGFRVRTAAMAVAIWFGLWIPLLYVPGAFVEPAMLRSPFWIRTFESLALAGACLILAGLAPGPVRENWIRSGRILFGVSLPVFAILHFIYPVFTAALIPPWYPWPLFWAWFTGAAHLAAGIAIASGVFARPAALLAGAMYGLWALTLHLPRQFMENPFSYDSLRTDVTSLFVAVGFWGAAWVVAGSLEGREAIRKAPPVAGGEQRESA